VIRPRSVCTVTSIKSDLIFDYIGKMVGYTRVLVILRPPSFSGKAHRFKKLPRLCVVVLCHTLVVAVLLALAEAPY
jgi:hypothetical protein